MAETVNFDQDSLGKAPAGWVYSVTGRGTSIWKMEGDASAPSKPNVLRQSGVGDFPICVKSATSVADGFVEVKFKSIAGKEDQAGGVMWRRKDKDNYYVARANALEDNVSLYYTTNGRRNTIKYVDAPVPKGVWHVLRVEFSGANIKVFLNGKRYIDAIDKSLARTGAVGVWTKADSDTAFDDFSFGRTSAK